jgi:uncharacterized membrane protein YccF (DUF307 family)
MVAPLATRRIAGDFFMRPRVWTRPPVREASLFPWERTAMNGDHASVRSIVVSGERFLGHTLAIVVGFMLMIAGLAMGVTIVLLPVGIPVGLGGLLLVLWALDSARLVGRPR